MTPAEMAACFAEAEAATPETAPEWLGTGHEEWLSWRSVDVTAFGREKSFLEPNGGSYMRRDVAESVAEAAYRKGYQAGLDAGKKAADETADAGWRACVLLQAGRLRIDAEYQLSLASDWRTAGRSSDAAWAEAEAALLDVEAAQLRAWAEGATK